MGSVVMELTPCKSERVRVGKRPLPYEDNANFIDLQSVNRPLQASLWPFGLVGQ